MKEKKTKKGHGTPFRMRASKVDLRILRGRVWEKSVADGPWQGYGSRQRMRHAVRLLTFLEINDEFPGEKRPARRRLALARARVQFKKWRDAER